MEKEEEAMKKADDQEQKQKLLNEEVVFLSKLEDQQLTHKMERLRKQINSPLALKLPDKGEKCRRSLKICEDELEKRNQLRPRKIITEDPLKTENKNSNQSPQKAENGNSNQSPQKDVIDNSNLSPQSAECGNSKQLPQKAECENSKQSHNSCSPVACNDCSSETPPSQACSQSKVNSLLQKRLEKGSPLRADADEFLGFNSQYQSDKERRSPLGAQDRDHPGFNRQHPYAYFSHRSFKRHRQPDTGIPTLHRIVRNLLEGPTTPRPHYQSHFRVPRESQMEELISTMEQQLETVHTQLVGLESQVTTRMDRLENVHTQLAGLESQVTTRMGRLEAKLEQIIQVQTGNKSTRETTSEQ